MASAGSGCSSFKDCLKPTQDKTNFIRLTRLLICGGTRVIRELFDFMIPSRHLAMTLSDPSVVSTLNNLRRRNILKLHQWNILYPPPGVVVESKLFDITLLFMLLREICGLTAPVTGWDNLPNSTDNTLEADLARIKYYRNTVYAHDNNDMEISDGDFQSYWKEIEAALLRIVASHSTLTVADCEKEIKDCFTASITDADERNVEELKWWYSQDMDLKSMVSSMSETLEEIHSSLGERQLERVHRERGPGLPEIIVKCVVKVATTGAWILGSACIFNRYMDDPETLKILVHNVVLPTGMVVVAILRGSIKFVLRATQLNALEELCNRYQTGRLRRDFEKVLITDDLRQFAKDVEVELEVTICKEEYKRAQDQLQAKEGEKLPEEFETKMRIEQKSSQFEILDGDVVEDGDNRVQAHLALITSKDQVEQVLAELKKKDPDVAEATHNIWAYRIFNTERNAFEENCDDDGDDSSAARVLRFLQRTGATDVMVVMSCWYETTAEDFGENRFKCIQKSILDLFLIYGIVRIPSARTKKFYEEIKYTPFENAKEQETPMLDILHGETIKDRKSTFQAHLADITSREQVDQVLEELKKDRKIGKATYNMWACRVYDEKKKSYFEEREDDGENLGGERLLHLLQRSDAKNVVIIVTRWHGGIHLGNDRFRHINKCAVDVLQSMGKIKAKDCGVPKSRIRRKSKAY